MISGAKKALIFDCDGVLADTERDGHLAAFNQMWRELNVDWHWTHRQYAEKLKIGGGKERLASLASDGKFRAVFPVRGDKALWDSTVAAWHRRKSEIYQDLVSSGKLPARPGVKRLAGEALAAGWMLAVCSTSAPASVEAIVRHVMGDDLAEKFSGIFAGDVVKAKKPASDIYDYALDRLGLSPEQAVAIEDSSNGLLAAHGAGLRCLVTYNDLTANEDFAGALLVVSDLGEPGHPMYVKENHSGFALDAYIRIQDIERFVAGREEGRTW